MKFKARIETIQSSVWSYIVRVPQEISDSVLKQDTKRVICKVNDFLNFQCALMPYGDGTYFLNFNQENRKKIDQSGLKDFDIILEIDNSEYGLPFPEELKELLELDQEGNKVFNKLTKGKQRTLLHIIAKPKSLDIRIRKAITIVDYLKVTNGNIDFKQLNEALKVRK